MAGSGKASGPKPGKQESISFETALKKLETLVEAMEEGDLPLESLLEKYEEGTRMVQACQAKLEEAELKIKTLEKSAAGESVLSPLATEASEEND